MAQNELLDLLERAEMSRSELARRLGVHRVTATQWGEAPEYALAYLRLYVAFKEFFKSVL